MSESLLPIRRGNNKMKNKENKNQNRFQYKVGDIVRLTSGGPPMTVIEPPDYDDDDVMVECAWFNTLNEMQQQELPLKALFLQP